MNAQLITICDTGIRRDAEGRYSLNDLHRAAGSKAKQRPGSFVRTDMFKALVAELETAQIRAVYTEPGRSGGTYACKELVYAYAMWISAKFQLMVIRAFDAMVTERQKSLEEINAELAPKATGYHLLTDSYGSRCITLAAKHLGVPPRQMFDWLVTNKWIFRRKGNRGYEAYSDRIHAGYIIERITPFNHSDGTPDFSSTPHITNKGLAHLATIFGATITEEAA